MTKRANFKHRIQQRREDAAERQAAYDKLSLDEKIQRAADNNWRTSGPSKQEIKLNRQKQAA